MTAISTKREVEKFAWCGKLSDDLTRDDLIEVIEFLRKELQEYKTPEARRALSLGKVAMLRLPNG